MTVPDSVYTAKCQNGDLLGVRVVHQPPANSLLIEDTTSFISVWSNRLEDANRYGREDLKAKAASVLEFMHQHSKEQIYILFWKDPKIGALLAEPSAAVLVMD